MASKPVPMTFGLVSESGSESKTSKSKSKANYNLHDVSWNSDGTMSLSLSLSLRGYSSAQSARAEALRLLKEDVRYSGAKSTNGTEIAISKDGRIYAIVSYNNGYFYTRIKTTGAYATGKKYRYVNGEWVEYYPNLG